MDRDQTVSNTSSDQGLGLHCLLRIIISLRCRKEKNYNFKTWPIVGVIEFCRQPIMFIHEKVYYKINRNARG